MNSKIYILIAISVILLSLQGSEATNTVTSIDNSNIAEEYTNIIKINQNQCFDCMITRDGMNVTIHQRI